jgi:hypothetical protein
MPRLAERDATYDARPSDPLRQTQFLRTEAPPFPESTLVALWLLGHVPEAALPWPLLRAGRAGRGPGPDVREATFLLPSGVPLTGDVEVHLRASDFTRHGHAGDPAYGGVVLHLCWADDRPPGAQGGPTPVLHADGHVRFAETVALEGVIDAAAVERLVARGPGPAAAVPCASASSPSASSPTRHDRVRAEGRRRLAERAWRAWRLADRAGVEGALRMLLERAVASSAGRRPEGEAEREALVAAILAGLGPDPAETLTRAALAGRAAFIETMRPPPPGTRPGERRAAEIAWNAALPLVAALAAAYEDLPLARATATLAEGWPAPAPYGRTRALAALLGPPPRGAGALHAQGLLHLQDLWCTRGGCGGCPLTSDVGAAGFGAADGRALGA